MEFQENLLIGRDRTQEVHFSSPKLPYINDLLEPKRARVRGHGIVVLGMEHPFNAGKE
jgi:hypothetical protein